MLDEDEIPQRVGISDDDHSVRFRRSAAASSVCRSCHKRALDPGRTAGSVRRGIWRRRGTTAPAPPNDEGGTYLRL